MRILVPSIVDPATFRGGAGTSSRGLLAVLESEPLAAQVDLLPSPLPRERTLHAWRRVTSVIRSLGSRLPAKALFQRSRTYEAAVRTALARGDYDLVLINGTDLLWILEIVPERIPVVAWAHNLEHELFARQLETMRLVRPVRWLLSRDLRKLEAFEIRGLTRASGTLFLSSRESEQTRPYLGRTEPLCIPPMFTYDSSASRRRPPSGATIELGFLANAEWWPNRDALGWILTDVLPHCDGKVRLNLFGQGMQRYGARSGAPGHAVGGSAAQSVAAYGYVSDLETVWSRCDVMICPIRTGAGVNVKVAEALYNGLPIVATSFAVDGLPVEAGPALAVLDGTQAWVDYLSSSRLRDLASAEVPAWQRERFTPRHHRAAVHDYFRRIAAGAAAARADG